MHRLLPRARRRDDRSHDFERHGIGVITCEHNHSNSRARVQALLQAQGHVRKHEAVSRFDDWYVMAPA